MIVSIQHLVMGQYLELAKEGGNVLVSVVTPNMEIKFILDKEVKSNFNLKTNVCEA